jgi:hypothetical protein
MSGVRTTRTHRQKGLRTTRKRNQVGGGEWFSPTGFEPLTGELAPLNILFTPSTADDTDDKKKQRINAWILAMQKQDELMRYGVRLAQKTFLGAGGGAAGGGAADSDEELQTQVAAQIDTLYDGTKEAETLTKMQQIFKDLEHVISLSAGTDWARNPPTNKFEMMFRSTMGESEKKLELAGVLLNPARCENVLTQSVIEVIRMLLEGANLEQIKPNLKGPHAELYKTLLIDKYTNFTVGYVQSTTNQTVRDGWILGGEFVSVEGNDDSIKTFWTKFIKELIKESPAITPGEPVGKRSYATHAAKYLKAKKAGQQIFDEILKAADRDGFVPEGVAYPPAAYLDIAYEGTKTLRQMFKKLQPEDFLFLQHLEGGLSTIPETAAAGGS